MLVAENCLFSIQRFNYLSNLIDENGNIENSIVLLLHMAIHSQVRFAYYFIIKQLNLKYTTFQAQLLNYMMKE